MGERMPDDQNFKSSAILYFGAPFFWVGLHPDELGEEPGTSERSPLDGSVGIEDIGRAQTRY